MNTSLKGLGLFLLFFGITFILYLPTVHSKFVFDFVDLYFDYQKGGFGDLFSRHGISSNLVSRAIIYSLISIVGLNDWIWFTISMAVHSLNALLFYLVAIKLLTNVKHTQAILVAFVTALLFLVLPYHTEVLVWGGAFNYLLVSLFVLLHSNFMMWFLKNNDLRSAMLAIISFSLAVFSHEWGLFLLPADLILLVFYFGSNQTKTSARSFVFLLVMLIITVVYFYNQFLHGQIIGHYGAETHLRLNPASLLQALFKYILKLLLFQELFPYSIQNAVYISFEKKSVLILLLGCFVLLLLTGIWLCLKNKQKAGLLFTGLLLFAIFLFPVLNLYFPYWTQIQGDRYCYLPSAFFYLSVLSLLFQKHKSMAILFCWFFIFSSLYFLHKKNENWDNAGHLASRLMQDFPKDSTKNFYLLNVPDNFNGAYMFRNLGKSCFAQTMRMRTGKDRNYQITDVQSYNLLSPYDSVIVSVLDSNTLHVELGSTGSWWWRGQHLNNDFMSVSEDANGHSYNVMFKKKGNNDEFLYQTGPEWRRVINF